MSVMNFTGPSAVRLNVELCYIIMFPFNSFPSFIDFIRSVSHASFTTDCLIIWLFIIVQRLGTQGHVCVWEFLVWNLCFGSRPTAVLLQDFCMFSVVFVLLLSCSEHTCLLCFNDARWFFRHYRDALLYDPSVWNERILTVTGEFDAFMSAAKNSRECCLVVISEGNCVKWLGKRMFMDVYGSFSESASAQTFIRSACAFPSSYLQSHNVLYCPLFIAQLLMSPKHNDFCSFYFLYALANQASAFTLTVCSDECHF